MYSTFSKHSCFLLGILLMSHHFVETQIDDPNTANAANNLFFFDRKSDCNQPIRNLYGLQGTIRGSDLSSLQLGPTKCVIRLKSEGQFDGVVLDIEVKAMRLQDRTTTVAIYDGDGEQNFLTSYDYLSNQQRNRFYTSGNIATFIMNRENVNSYNFDIEIIVLPVRASQVPNYENNFGKDNPYAFDKFPQEYIVGMLSGFYLFIIVLCLVVVLYKWKHFSGQNKTWETHQLATLKAGSGFDVRSQMSQPSHIATLDGVKSRGPASQYSHSTVLAKVPPSEDGDSGVYYNEENNQKRRLVNDHKETAKAAYTTNSVYSEPEDAPEDAPENFKEKIIVPSNFKGRNRRPPSYAEATSERGSENSSDEESEVSSSNASVRKRPLSSDEEKSDRSSERSRSTARTRSTRSPTPSESESEEESESDGSSSGHHARARRGKHRHKKQPEPKKFQRPARPQQPQQQPPPPQMVNPNIRPGMYGAYPPGQFVPIMAGPPQFQPAPGYPPPRYQSTMGPARGPQVQPTDIPVYSYLVQRGYKPIDPSNGSNTSSESQRPGGRRVEEPDLRLDSGVEYMKR